MRARWMISVLVLLALVWTGCRRAYFRAGVPKSPGMNAIKVVLESGSDPVIGQWNEFRIENLTSNSLSGITLTINERWSAHLSDLKISVDKNSDPSQGLTQIPAHAKAYLHSSGDVPNYLKFKNPSGQSLPTAVRYESITISHDNRDEKFEFR